MPPSKAAIHPIQLSNRSSCRAQVAAVVDDIVGDRQSFAATRLRGQHSLRLFDRLRVACEQALDLECLVAVDDEHAVDELQQRRLGEQWNDNELVRPVGQFRLPAGFRADAWVQDGFQLSTCLIVGEDDLAHCGSIEIPVGADHALAESFAEFVECRLPGHNDFPGNDIGVDNRNAEF